MKFKVVFMAEAFKFIEGVPKKAGDKMLDIIHRVKSGEQNSELFSKLEGTEIWEFRILYSKIKYRLFAFWDTEDEALVVVTHGLIKKTPKTPLKEIKKAEKLRKEFFNAKMTK